MLEGSDVESLKEDYAMTVLTAAPVNCRRVAGRRQLRYRDFEALLSDAEQLAASPTRALGNWSLGQALKHLALMMEMAVDGNPFDAHWLICLVARLMFRHRLIHSHMSPGFQLPAAMAEYLVPRTDVSTEEGLASLRAAISRMQAEPLQPSHPLLGAMSADEWREFHLRHAELHLSFIVPQE
jgi:hypothetical protein